MRLPFPGPAAVIGGAMSAAEAVETAIGLVPRAVDAMTRVEALLDRAEGVIARTEAVVDEAAESNAKVRATVDAAGVVTRDAGRRVDGAGGLVDRMDTMLGTWEPVGRKLAPQATRFAEQLSSHEVDAAISLIDRMPVVLEHLDSDLLPVLRTLDRVGPDVHELLNVLKEVRQAINGIPGFGLLRRRGERDEG